MLPIIQKELGDDCSFIGIFCDKELKHDQPRPDAYATLMAGKITVPFFCDMMMTFNRRAFDIYKQLMNEAVMKRLKTKSSGS